MRHVLENDAPAARFADCYLLGNGSLGVAVRGGVGAERLSLNLDTLWSGGPVTRGDARPPGDVQQLRAAVAAGDHARADRLARALQASAWVQSFQPLGWIDWQYDPGRSDVPTGYRRNLHLLSGIASTADATGVLLETFVSSPDRVLVCRATGPSTTAVPRVGSPHPVVTSSSSGAGVTWMTMSGRAPADVLPHYVDGEPPVTYAADDPDADGLVDAGMGFALVVAWVPDESGGSLVAAAESGFRGWQSRPSADVEALAAVARARVEAALAVDVGELRRRHVLDQQEVLGGCELDLSPSAASNPEAARAELYFDLGRHLLAAGSRPGTQPLTLQGIWNDDVRPAWSSNLTTNINTPMSYWGAEVSGLGTLHEPLLDLVEDLLEAGRRTARETYGARGACVHHNTDLWRFTDPVPGLPQWVNWASALWWLTDHAVQHHAYLGPGPEADAFLANRVLPALRASAAFALDMLVPHSDGALVVSPSSSPEHAFLADGRPYAVTWGSAMDQELVHDILTSTVELVGSRGRDADDAELVREASAALARLRLPVAFDGIRAEWADDLEPEEVGHRHLSHLYGVFPGHRSGAVEPQEELQASRAALALRLAEGSGYTGWSQAWVLCLAARLRDGALAERAIETLLGPLSSRSLLDLHPLDGWPGGAVFQIDGNLGAVAGIAELVVQSHDGVVALLPALPAGWPSGRARGLRVRGGDVVDLEWEDGALASAVIHAVATRDVVVELPGDGQGRARRTVSLRAGETAVVVAP
ncbi:glycosyl hydrolase family 95 catalytic domain-containing protein [Cellulomonas alba]|uniref:Glycoside hydrolase N-terminal domain-containing protein n=1 Tax=Cellulomonas alba TaxID=3053467 RepID=A0ABT7SJP4_9CELL|nr:glycoside hydrolase N-terminal domain-containing protein [Cellulomonas alba]MDM7856404.1 glycoside hydrolase N-terminal domain-containing protein [Cellulomonas alba]